MICCSYPILLAAVSRLPHEPSQRRDVSPRRQAANSSANNYLADRFLNRGHKTADRHIQRPTQGKNGWQVRTALTAFDQPYGVDVKVSHFGQLQLAPTLLLTISSKRLAKGNCWVIRQGTILANPMWQMIHTDVVIQIA